MSVWPSSLNASVWCIPSHGLCPDLDRSSDPKMEDCSTNESTVVRRFAQDEIAPKVREMDEKELMDPAIIKGLFENGVSATPCFHDHRLSLGSTLQRCRRWGTQILNIDRND